MAPGRATEDTLDLLHALVASSQAEELKRAVERARQPIMIPDPEDPTGKRQVKNPNYEPLSPKLLAVVIKFLKDNGIDAPAHSERFNGVLDELRSLNVDDQGALAH